MTYKNQKRCHIHRRAVSACIAEIASVLISGHGSYNSAENIFIIEFSRRRRCRRVFQSETAHRTRPLQFAHFIYCAVMPVRHRETVIV